MFKKMLLLLVITSSSVYGYMQEANQGGSGSVELMQQQAAMMQSITETALEKTRAFQLKFYSKNFDQIQELEKNYVNDPVKYDVMIEELVKDFSTQSDQMCTSILDGLEGVLDPSMSEIFSVNFKANFETSLKLGLKESALIRSTIYNEKKKATN